MQLLGRDQAEDAISEKFKPLVRRGGVGARMGQRAPQQVAILEVVAEARFQVSR